jgi:acetyl-CoA C-acetyltransferase
VVGIESMSNVPFLLTKLGQGYRMGLGELHDGCFMTQSSIFYNIIRSNGRKSRGEIQYQPREQMNCVVKPSRACAAIAAGKYKDEIVP